MSIIPLLRNSAALSHLFRHLLLYAPLVRAAAQEYQRATLRRLVYLAVAAFAALAVVIVGALWLVLSAWQQEYRHWLIGGAFAALALLSFLMLRFALVAPPEGPRLANLRRELAQDKALLSEWNRDP